MTRREEQDYIIEVKRERERQRLAEKKLMDNCLYALEIGSISILQVEDWLFATGAPKAVIDRLAYNIKISAYSK